MELEKSIFSNHHHNYAFSKETSKHAKPSEWNLMRNGYLLSKVPTIKYQFLMKENKLIVVNPAGHNQMIRVNMTSNEKDWVPPNRMACKEHSSTSVIFLRNKIHYLNFIMRKRHTSRWKDWNLQKCQPWKSSEGWGLFR